MPLMKKYFNNTRKPEGFLGKMMIAGMNAGHAKVSAWGISHLPELHPAQVADFGCGGGKNIAALLKTYPSAKVVGLDYSEVSVAESKKANKQAISAGRCQVLQGDVSALPMEDSQFDLVTAFETVYFWPGPVKSFKEVFRVLQPGGVFMIVNEADGENPADDKWLEMIDGMRIYSADDMAAYLREAGFAEIKTIRAKSQHRICFIAKKPNRE